MSLQGLMKVPDADRDIQWLLLSLQEAVQLEWSTIPPYLCAYWSIRQGSSVSATTQDIAATIQTIVVQEMLHMGLACNILAGIGGTPCIYSENFAPKYPGELPGHVHEGLVVGLAGLSQGQAGNKDQVAKFMQIELPEHPLAWAAKRYATIGEFYDALSAALDQIQPSFDLDRQLTNSWLSDLVKVKTVEEAKSAIDFIKRQGEGTSSSPFADGTRTAIAPPHELAHYYRFGEIYAEHKLAMDAGSPTGWSFCGASLPFPQANELYLMAEVPVGGYPESDDFDKAYTSMLKLLHEAWAEGDEQKLSDAVDAMGDELRPAAIDLLDAGHPAPSGGIKGPDFRFLRF